MSADEARGRVKCVAWDLDDTVWSGTLLEDGDVHVRPEIVAAMRTLDARGVLNSIASRNDADLALARLRATGLDELVLHPQIGWGAKSVAIPRIAEQLGIGLDAIAFVDDQPFERAEVSFALPQVLCVDVADIVSAVATRPEFRPRFVTEESRMRRNLYRSEARRREGETEFAGTSEEFLATLGMTMTTRRARAEDLQRAEELTVRTHQLNSTGCTYSHDQLELLRISPDHLLLVASLSDRFGEYGTIGLALVDRGSRPWHLRLLLMSCRVVARGVGTVLLNHILALAHDAGAGVRGDFVHNDRNRTMYITYKVAGFDEVSREGNVVVLERGADEAPPPPSYLTLVTEPPGD